jgi:outer membrane protein assembly factor BamD (BamD/ComL family)
MRNLLSTGLSIVFVVVSSQLTGGCASDGEARTQLETGYAALETGNYDAAMAAADEQLRRAPGGPGSAEALYLRGRALEQRRAGSPQQSKSDWQAARAAYQEALNQKPSPQLEAHIRCGLANVAYFQDDYNTAMREWATAYERLDDAAAKGWVLYRLGLCHQRMGSFQQADKLFAQVQQEYPNTVPAERAREHQGARSFAVQLATYANRATADAAVAALRQEGVNPTQTVDPQGRTVVRVGPMSNYQQALTLKQRYAYRYPDALILP